MSMTMFTVQHVFLECRPNTSCLFQCFVWNLQYFGKKFDYFAIIY